MPLISGDFVSRLSGGSGNSSGNASLGGAKSSNAASSTVDQLFDQVSASEATAGDTEYRCIYLHNGNGSSSMLNTVVWISSNTPSASTTLDIGVGTAAVNGTEQTIANESTAPVSVTFSAPSTQGTGLALGDIPPGEHKAIWLRRTVSAAAGAVASDPVTINFAADYTS
jgi:hypothetical protein